MASFTVSFVVVSVSISIFQSSLSLLVKNVTVSPSNLRSLGIESSMISLPYWSVLPSLFTVGNVVSSASSPHAAKHEIDVSNARRSAESLIKLFIVRSFLWFVLQFIVYHSISHKFSKVNRAKIKNQKINKCQKGAKNDLKTNRKPRFAP